MANPRMLLGRTTLAIAAIAIGGFSASGQERRVVEKRVPAAIINAFKTAYPTATIKGFSREKENGKVFYEIESKDGEVRRDVLYNPDGSVAEIEETIAPVELPSTVQELIRSKYAGAVVTKAEKLTAGDKVGYEVILRKGKRRMELEFDADGNLKNTAK